MRTPLLSWILATSVVPIVLLSGSLAKAAQPEEIRPFPECTREPTDADIAAAKAAFQAGNASFNEADYPRAILYWEDAYRRDCTAHALLLNLARAYELGGQKRQAVVALETYLARKPDANDKDQITRRIDVLNNQIQQEQASQAQSAASTSPDPATAPPPVASPAPPPADTSGDTSPKRPLGPLIVMGVGGAVAVVGGILWLSATGDVNDYEERCGGDRFCPDNVTDDANKALDRQTLWGVVSLVGVGIAAGGAAWYFLTPPPAQAATKVLPAGKLTRVTPRFSPGFAGVSVSGAF